MPRPPRLEIADDLYHLMSRGNGRHYGSITSMAVCMDRRRFREEQAEQHRA